MATDLKHKGAIMTSSSQLLFHKLLLTSGPLYGDFLFGRQTDLKHKGAISTSSSQLWFHRLSLPSGPLYGDFFFFVFKVPWMEDWYPGMDMYFMMGGTFCAFLYTFTVYFGCLVCLQSTSTRSSIILRDGRFFSVRQA